MTIQRNERVERLVQGWVLAQALSDVHPDHHLSTCDEVILAEHTITSDIICDTGCQHVSWDAVVTCPHGERREISGGEFGELAMIIEDLEVRDANEARSAE